MNSDEKLTDNEEEFTPAERCKLRLFKQVVSNNKALIGDNARLHSAINILLNDQLMNPDVFYQ